MPTISLDTWQQHVARHGEDGARQRLRGATRHRKMVPHPRKRDGLSVVWDLIHTWPRLTPQETRKKFAGVIRIALHNIRNDRKRIDGYRVPGQAWHRLP